MWIRAAWRVSVAAVALLIVAGASFRSNRSSASVDTSLSSLSVHVCDEAGRPLVARVRVAPISWAERARLAMWTDPHVFSDEPIDLAAGEYQVFVSRGPEWSLVRLPFTAARGRSVVQRVTLRHEISLQAYRSADLHVHTAHSEDARERGGVKERDLRAEGVELAVASDHNRVGDLGPEIESVPGAELTTWAPEVGHFNAFPLKSLPAFRGTTPRKLFRELKRDPSVFVQVNHPRLEDHIAYFMLGEFDGQRFRKPEFDVEAHGIEVYNGYDLARPSAVRRLLAEWRTLTAQGRRLTATGGSDSHGPRGHLPGYPRTYVRAANGLGMAPALKAGQAFVTNGPLIELRVHGKQVGDTLRVDDGELVLAELTVLAPSWMEVERAELWAGSKRLWSAAIPERPTGQPLRFVRRIRVAVDDARTLTAVAEGGRGLDALVGRSNVTPLAFTNPIYLTRRGDGHRPHDEAQALTQTARRDEVVP